MPDNKLFLPPADQVKFWFTHSDKPLPAAEGTVLTQIHNSGRELALQLATLLPDSPESLLALDRLQESIMWANTAISREPRK